MACTGHLVGMKVSRGYESGRRVANEKRDAKLSLGPVVVPHPTDW